MTPESIHELVRHVTPQSARNYANANGWRRVFPDEEGIAIFDREDAELDQLIVPLEASAPDYARRMVDVATILSERECRPIEEILNDLLMPEADVLRYRISSTDARRGDLPLEHIVGVLEGARRSLLAAACSVLSPVRHHPRMSRTEATQLLESARFRQTERGSFTIAIACPLGVVETQEPLFDREAPFTRQTTTLLMRSVTGLARAIQADNVDSLLESPSDDVPLSANLCDAILRMQPVEEGASLSIAANWASTLPLDPQVQLRRSVKLQYDHFPIIESIYKKLRPASQPTHSPFVGYVDALNGDMGDDGRMQGDTTVLVLHEEEMLKARVNLNADEYGIAIDAHKIGGLVQFVGVLHRGRRTHRITGIKDFCPCPNRNGD